MKKNVKVNKSNVNIAIVGYGYWGPNIVRNFQEIDNASLIACCDTKKEQLDLAKKKYPQIKITSSFKDLLTNPSIEAIIIATPTKTHYTLAKKALLAGKHVWIEKPMTETSEQAIELLAIAQKKKKTIHIGHVFIYTEAIAAIKHTIERGELGDLYYFDSVRINLGLFQHDINVIWDLAPHDISIMLYLFNEYPKAVSAFATSHVVKGLEDTAYLNFKFKSGKNAHVHVSWLSPVKVRKLTIAGSKKMILYDDLEESDKIKIYDKGLTLDKKLKPVSTTSGYHYRVGDIFSPAIANKEALETQCREFVNAIKANKSSRTSGKEGLRVVKILEAATLSMKKNGALVEII